MPMLLLVFNFSSNKYGCIRFNASMKMNQLPNDISSSNCNLVADNDAVPLHENSAFHKLHSKHRTISIVLFDLIWFEIRLWLSGKKSRYINCFINFEIAFEKESLIVAMNTLHVVKWLEAVSCFITFTTFLLIYLKIKIGSRTKP